VTILDPDRLTDDYGLYWTRIVEAPLYGLYSMIKPRSIFVRRLVQYYSVTKSYVGDNLGIRYSPFCALHFGLGTCLGHTSSTHNMDLRSHRTQLVLTALAASASTAALFSIYSEWDRRRRRQHLQQDVLRSLNAGPLPEAVQAEKAAAAARPDLDENAEVLPRPLRTDIQYDEELIREQLARNYAFFGETGMERVRTGRVVIVGCGGVGSWAAVMLARS
jgi:hypothetical protein